MKPITELAGLQGPIGPSHTTGGGRVESVRRLIRRNFPATPGNQKNNRNATPKKPFSLRRPKGDESNGTHTDASNLIPSILHERDGRNDKIHIYCRICTVTCDTEEDAQDFIFHLGGPPSNQLEHPEQFSRLFTIAPHQGNGNKLEIRSKPFICGGRKWQPPIFSGKLRVTRGRRDDDKIALFIYADLFLNVNRALNHQRKKLADQSPDAIYANDGPVKKGLCGGDNLAPLVLRPCEHDNARSRYIKSAIAVVLADTRRAARISECEGSGRILVNGKPTDYSLREVETCWEVGGVGFDALQALADITPALRNLGGRQGWESNAGTMTIVFSGSERLVVYAKTPDRLRIEIRHTPPKGNVPYTAPSITGLIAKINEFRGMAAKRINRHLRPLRARLTGSPSQEARESYVLDWGACCGNSEASKAILRMLLREGRVMGGGCLECLPRGKELLRKARDAGLVRHELGAYRPIMPEGIGSALTSFDNSASFPGRNTETQPVVSVPKSPTPIRIVRESKGIPPSPPLTIVDCRLLIED